MAESEQPVVHAQLMERATDVIAAGFKKQVERDFGDAQNRASDLTKWAVQEAYKRGVADGFVEGVAAANREANDAA